jgi:hypothetical protein
MNNAKIFGIGLSRTGTKSLATALNQLAIKTRWFPHDRTTHRQLITGNFRLKVLESYDGMTDTPAAVFYPQFDALYPNSKFILTTREKDSWLRSCRDHWWRARIRPASIFSPQWRKFAAYINCAVYGCTGFEEGRFAYAYDVHHLCVQQYFADRPEDLLIVDFQAGDGWDQLCTFLQIDVPRTPFPRVNRFDAPTLN